MPTSFDGIVLFASFNRRATSTRTVEAPSRRPPACTIRSSSVVCSAYGYTPGRGDLAADRETAAVFQVMDTRHDQYVVTPQGNIGQTPRKNSRQVHGHDLRGKVLLLPKQLRTTQESILTRTLRAPDQLPDRTAPLAKLVHAGTIDCPLHLHTVRIAVQRPPDSNRIPVHQRKSPVADAVHVKQLVLASRGAHHADLSSVGIAREAPGIRQQLRKRLPGFQLVAHRAFDAPRDLHQKIVRRNQHDIALFQTDVVFRIPVEKVLVNVNGGDLPTAAKHPDIAQGTDVCNTTGFVQRMEDRGERRQAVCARGCDLSQNVHLNRPQLTQRNTDIRRGSLTRNARIFPREKTAKAVVGCADRKPVQVDRTQLIEP